MMQRQSQGHSGPTDEQKRHSPESIMVQDPKRMVLSQPRSLCLLPPRDTGPYLEIFLIVSIQWVEVRDAAQYFIMHKTVPTPNKELSGTNINNADVEKPFP